MNFATLFDYRYLVKGVCLIDSMRRHLSDWHVWVLAMDEVVWDYFCEHRMPNVTAVRLDGIETARLEAIRHERTWQEYCWTLASVFTYDVMTREELASVAYIDADMFLFGDLAPVYQEIKDAPVAIVPHRWSPQHAERLKPNGTYNVCWVYFDGVVGRMALEQWRDQCLDWCYYRIEDGKMADQRYLEDWPERWGAKVIEHLGFGLAPWNQEQYEYEWDGERLWVVEMKGDQVKRMDPTILYHFHNHNGVRQRSGYPLHPIVAQHLYREYEHLQETFQSTGMVTR